MKNLLALIILLTAINANAQIGVGVYRGDLGSHGVEVLFKADHLLGKKGQDSFRRIGYNMMKYPIVSVFKIGYSWGNNDRIGNSLNKFIPVPEYDFFDSKFYSSVDIGYGINIGFITIEYMVSFGTIKSATNYTDMDMISDYHIAKQNEFAIGYGINLSVDIFRTMTIYKGYSTKHRGIYGLRYFFKRKTN